MFLRVQAFTEDHAIQMCTWKYEVPYDVYNTDWKTVQEQNWGMTDKRKRAEEFHSVYDGNEFVGFFRLVKKEGYFMLGLGLRPDVCGKGLGKELISLIKNYFGSYYPASTLRLEVRDFNSRAIKCYRKCGFHIIDKYRRNTFMGNDRFLLMECRC